MMIKSAFLLIGLGIATGALAQPALDPAPLASETITYGDLNVGSTAGRAALRHRIQAAAGRVCDMGGMAAMEDFIAAAQCYRLSYRDGLRQMDRLVAGASAGSTLAASALVVTAR